MTTEPYETVSPRIRVAWITMSMARGGSETLLLNSARVLDPDLFAISCFYRRLSDNDFLDELTSAGVNVQRVGSGQSTIRVLDGFARCWRRRDVDIIHVHAPTLGLLAVIAARIVRHSRHTPIVVTVHNNLSTWRPSTRLGWRLAWNRVAEIIAVSEDARASLPTQARERAVTVRQGVLVDSTVGLLPLNQQRLSRASSPTALTIVTVANLRWTKNHANLIRAARALKDGGLEFKWNVVGDGDLRDTIASEIASFELSDSVFLLGSRSDVPDLLREADLFVLSSDIEGLPVAVMEALAAGLPVVSTAVGGMIEEFRDSRAVCLAPARNPEALAHEIRRIWLDNEVRQQMREAALVEARRFDISDAAELLGALYKRIATGASRTEDNAR